MPCESLKISHRASFATETILVGESRSSRKRSSAKVHQERTWRYAHAMGQNIGKYPTAEERQLAVEAAREVDADLHLPSDRTIMVFRRTREPL